MDLLILILRLEARDDSVPGGGAAVASAPAAAACSFLLDDEANDAGGSVFCLAGLSVQMHHLVRVGIICG